MDFQMRCIQRQNPRRLSYPVSVIALAAPLFLALGCAHVTTGQQGGTAMATVRVDRPEDNGSVNIVPCVIVLNDGQTCALSGGDSVMISVQPGRLWLAASSLNPYSSPDSGYPTAWRSHRFHFHVARGEVIRISVEPKSRNSTYVGGWTLERAAYDHHTRRTPRVCSLCIAGQRRDADGAQR